MWLILALNLGKLQQYKNLQPVLTDSINWQLIKEQYCHHEGGERKINEL